MYVIGWYYNFYIFIMWGGHSYDITKPRKMKGVKRWLKNPRIQEAVKDMPQWLSKNDKMIANPFRKQYNQEWEKPSEDILTNQIQQEEIL
ncbi:MAG TPA: hypothetical protein VGK47_00960, partial [Nitrososphaeraceae archaeon]